MALSDQQEFNLYSLCQSLFPSDKVQSLTMDHLKRLLPYVQFDNPKFCSLDEAQLRLSEIKKPPKAIDAIIDEFCQSYPINMWNDQRQLKEPLKDPTIADLLEQHGSGCNKIKDNNHWLSTDDISAICFQFNEEIKGIPALHIIEPQASSSSTISDKVLKVEHGKDQTVPSIAQQAQDHFTRNPTCKTVLAPFVTGGLGGKSIAGSSASHWNLAIYTKDDCGNEQCETVNVHSDGFCGDWVLQKIAERISAEGCSSELITGYTGVRENVKLRQHTIARLRDHSPHQSILANREYISKMAQSLDIQRSLDSSNAGSSAVVKSGPTLFKSQPQSSTVGVQTKPEVLRNFQETFKKSLHSGDDLTDSRFSEIVDNHHGVSFNYRYLESTSDNGSDTSSTGSANTDHDTPDSGSDSSAATPKTKTVGIIAKHTSQGETFSVAPSSQPRLTGSDQQMACLMQIVLEKHCLLEGKAALDLTIPEQFIGAPVDSEWIVEQINLLKSHASNPTKLDGISVTVNGDLMVENGQKVESSLFDLN